MACRFAICPTSRSPPSARATMEGVVREPSLFGITTASPPSMTATQELVVPRSMPITLLMLVSRPSGSAAGRLFPGWRRHHHRRRPDEPVVQVVPAVLLLHHHPRRVLAGGDRHERL